MTASYEFIACCPGMAFTLFHRPGTGGLLVDLTALRKYGGSYLGEKGVMDLKSKLAHRQPLEGFPAAVLSEVTYLVHVEPQVLQELRALNSDLQSGNPKKVRVAEKRIFVLISGLFVAANSPAPTRVS